MLRHAFEVLGCQRVEFETDSILDREWPLVEARLSERLAASRL
jgi:hypothetical protein